MYSTYSETLMVRQNSTERVGSRVRTSPWLYYTLQCTCIVHIDLQGPVQPPRHLRHRLRPHAVGPVELDRRRVVAAAPAPRHTRHKCREGGAQLAVVAIQTRLSIPTLKNQSINT